MRIAEKRYAIFHQRSHISTIRSGWNSIWNNWLPESEYEVVDAPDFGLYDDGFDSVTGMGDFEIWIPIDKCSKPQQEK